MINELSSELCLFFKISIEELTGPTALEGFDFGDNILIIISVSLQEISSTFALLSNKDSD